MTATMKRRRTKGGGQAEAGPEMNAMIRIEGVTGPSEKTGFVGWFSCSRFQVEATGSGHVTGHTTGAGREAKPSCGEIQCTLLGSVNAHEIFRRLLNGTVIPQVQIARPAMDNAGQGKKDLEQTLTNAVITGAAMSLDDNGDFFIDLSMAFSKWKLETFRPEGPSAGAVEIDGPKGVVT